MSSKLCIIGTGYVGLVSGACFAEVGHKVICVDCDEAKVKMLRAGGIPIYEPGLEELVKKNVAEGRLSFTVSTEEGVENSDIIFLAVPTPPQPDGSVDLTFIERVARDIAACMTSYKIVVDKSTVPVKTGQKVSETISRYCKSKVEFDVVSNPEFLREGFAVEDLMKPDRVVIGVQSPRPVVARANCPIYLLAGAIDPVVPVWPVLRWLRKNCPMFKGHRIIWPADHTVLATEPSKSLKQIDEWVQATDRRSKAG